ncbi:energy-coupling factor transporter ATPase [Streptococcus lactarius]|uniref:Energy-coupling factor transporter ATP-binding protein EcfA2 n=1 Tax=Streptococcus lactarius TaxID=684066 RepID=A0A9X1BAU9_9STRE|nr:energy-coupling factor transporter ATPase [Streptococcus lactarius]MBK4779268.1 energy-coupling factor transporter ATPase [Streptococcus lactarius]QUB38897.1 energy-coupling factor transporter ATPase [Streptococcus lactarius]
MGISLKNVYYTYQEGSPFEGQALSDISLEIKDGSYTAFVGHTGSGKSTLLQLLNGLLCPTQGEIQFDDFVLDRESDQKKMKHLRKKVGLVFQFPESQLFAETVLADVAFGPQNFGVSRERAEEIAKDKLAVVGLNDAIYNKSPFELSGGQMRRVAIAGILAIEPEILVLDEPTAGLDPVGRKELMALFETLHKNGMTIVLVTHTMDDVANFADTVYVLKGGNLVLEGSPSSVFQEVEYLQKIQLGVPKITNFALQLQQKGLKFERLPIKIEELKEMLLHE